MAEQIRLHHPRLVAVWPGMGQVALNAGVYLLAKLNMSVIAEFEANDLFDVEHVEVKDGIIQSGRRPRNRLFLWTDPEKRHDLVVFLGEAQPPVGKYAFCRQLIKFAEQLGVERIFTFAAMATQMHPEQRPRVFGAATDQATLAELRHLELELLEDGNIGGLNGVLLGCAPDAGLHGACLLGEIPHIFSQLPFPKASLAILEVFGAMTDIQIDYTELAEQARASEQQLVELLGRVEETLGQQINPPDEFLQQESSAEPKMKPSDQERIDTLFALARKDRSKAFELKQELDRLGVFKEFEDLFLDLFKKPSAG